VTVEHAALLVGLAALVLDYMRARKLDDRTADRVVDLAVAVASLEARVSAVERDVDPTEQDTTDAQSEVLERCGVWLSPEQVRRWADALVRRGEP
jgi:Tfp pilus assembly protein PilX